MDDDELYVYAKEIRAPVELVRQTKHLGRLPVVNFAAGGVATPADAALMMQLGMDGVFVGSGIFKSGDPASRARAIVQVGGGMGRGGGSGGHAPQACQLTGWVCKLLSGASPARKGVCCPAYPVIR